MEKKAFFHGSYPWILKLLKIMRLTFFLILISFFSVLAGESYSQSTRLTLSANQITLEKLLNVIEDQSEYRFFYTGNVDVEKRIDADFKNESIAKVLSELSAIADFDYEIKGRQIVLSANTKNEILQQKDVTGKVTDSSGSSLPGVSIVIKGTTTGTITDFDGNFSLSYISSDATLVFSFVGMKTQEIAVAGQSVFNIVMEEDAIGVGEVIVTALGIKREKKTVTYSTQNVDVEEISEARSLNVINSLSGKIAGLNLSTTSNGVGSPSRVTLRGNRSLTGNNQPLYVIDGVPIDNSVSTPTSDVGRSVSSDGISNINPNDIESISVLKGPSASALYGSRASNGVIIITTKSGQGASGIKVSVTSNLMVSGAYDLLDLQNVYGQGNQGTYSATSRESWGPKMTGQSVGAWQLVHNPDYSGPSSYNLSPQPNNVMDFFQTGTNWTNGISATMGKENVQGYFSYTNTYAEGIVGGNELDRHNINLRLTSDLSDKFKLDIKTNYIVQKIDNPLETGEVAVGAAAYNLPRSLPYEQYKDFEYLDGTGQIQYNYVNRDEIGGVGGNPFWMAQRRNSMSNERSRFIGFASLKYEITKSLSLQIRSGIDQYTDKSKGKGYAAQAYNSDKGYYSESISETREMNNDFLISFNDDFEDFSVNLSAGGNSLSRKISSLSSGGMLSRRNFFAIGNLDNANANSGFSHKEINSLYAFTQLGFKDYLFLDVTARNDWSSTLPSDNRSYFYPSAGVTAIISDMFKELPNGLSFFKLRASYAQVGNDTSPYQLAPDLVYFGGNGGIVTSSPLLKNANLKPEISTSVEIGSDIRFFDNRLGIDFTWFKTNTVDQIFTINTPESSGYAQEVINGGEVENKGVEFVINAMPVKKQDFSWDITANFAKYTSEIIEINGEREELIFGAGRLVESKITKGGEYGDLYIRGFKRTSSGEIIVDSNGIPEFTNGFDVLAGNFNPDWTGGIKNRFSYKNLTLSFLIDMRIGGEVISYTQSRQAGIGVSGLTLANRDGGLIVDGVVATYNDNGDIVSTAPNNTAIDAETYWKAVAPRDPRSAEDFVFDATNIRLRELVFGYSLPKRLLKQLPFSSVNLSLVGRNLFFITNKAKYFDPEQGVGIGNLQGVESFNLPTTRDFGFNVKIDF